ncbi:MAG TPA: hypothetical protein PKW98_13695, partial [Candidatus Wallbacteria bacterium]|nr:hypothetical protein [Candidatus Wallbacteria bacterium]
MKNNSNKKGFNPDELVADMLNSSSAEIVVGPDGTIMTKNEAIKKDVDGTRLLKQRVWGAARSNVEKLIAALDFRGKGKNSAGKDDAGKGRGAAKSEKSCKYSNARDECGEESEIDQFENDEEGEDYESAKNFKTTNSGKIAKGGKYANEDDAESMLSSSSAEIVVGPDGTIMTKNEA